MTTMAISVRSLAPLRVLCFTVMALLVLLRTPLLSLDLYGIATVSAALSVLAVFVVGRSSARGAWSASTAYLLVFCLFHFGLAYLAALRLAPPEYMAEYISAWFNGYGAGREALYLTLLACWAFTTASVFTARPPTQVALPSHDPVRGAVASKLGAALVVIGVGLLLGLVAVTAPGLLIGAGGRDAYWDVVEGSTVQFIAAPLISYGAILTGLGSPGAARRFGLVALAVFGAWALVVGARTAIMYTAVAVVVVIARRRKMPKARVAVVAAVIGLVVVGFVGQARLSGGYASRASIDPRAGIAEMGGSLRPVIEVLELRRINNEPLMLGVTYVSFVARAAEQALGLPRPDGLTDLRIAGNELRAQDSSYNMGYSAVAEAVRNGDAGGILIVFTLLGIVLGRLDARSPSSVSYDYWVGAVLFVLIWHVRQSSVSMVLSLVLAAGTYLLWRVVSSQAEARQRRSGSTGSVPTSSVVLPARSRTTT